MMKNKHAVSTGLAAVSIVVMLIVGIAIGAFVIGPMQAAPAIPKTITVTKTEVIRETETVAGGIRGEVQIGALLTLTGALASYGENSRTALERAEADVNDFLRQSGAGFTIKLVIEDTQTKPEVALEKLQSLAARGIKIVIGPMTSAEVRQLKSYADSNKILLISQSSTAPALAIPGDFVYRLVTDDTIQGPIGPRFAKQLGVTHIIYVWRGDAWGDGIHDVSSEEARRLGIKIAAEIRYSPEKKEFAAESKALADTVKELLGMGIDPRNIMVEIIGFDEVAQFILQASEYPELERIRWFGSDGTAKGDVFVKDPKVAAFVEKVVWVNPVFAPNPSEKRRNVEEFIKQKLGRSPDPYALSAYDALWLVALSLLTVDKYDADAVRKVLPQVAQNYFGAVGWIVLNEAGDLAGANYELWVVKKKNGKYDWELYGMYIYSTGQFQIKG